MVLILMAESPRPLLTGGLPDHGQEPQTTT